MDCYPCTFTPNFTRFGNGIESLSQHLRLSCDIATLGRGLKVGEVGQLNENCPQSTSAVVFLVCKQEDSTWNNIHLMPSVPPSKRPPNCSLEFLTKQTPGKLSIRELFLSSLLQEWHVLWGDCCDVPRSGLVLQVQ